MLWGLSLTKVPLLLSIDINECELETDNCHMNADCTDTIGSFECTCNSGFVGDGVNCTSMYMSLKISYWCGNVVKHINCNLIVQCSVMCYLCCCYTDFVLFLFRY